MKSEKIDYNYLKSNNFILYEVISGSIAYGTNLPSSDEDRRYVYILPQDYILSGNIIEQVNDDTNDVVGYEIGRFLNLISSANPNLLELLNTPEDCVIYKHPVFDLILENRDKFITKICAKSFGGYAKQQISKAKGQDKKQNWEKERVIRKTPLDFCYIHKAEHSISLRDYLELNRIDQSLCGLSKSPHSKDLYSLFYSEGFTKFKGIAFEDSNDIRLSSIPKDLPEDFFIGHVSYNKDAYSQHCKDYLSYEEWLKNRNESRWVDVKSHGQKIDGKNMMHCKRLMDMAKEIGEGKGVNVRRPNAKDLISIRKGEVDLQTLIEYVESGILVVDKIFENSNLPDSVDSNFVNKLLVKIRKSVYNI